MTEIEIELNGETRLVAEGTTIAALLEQMGIASGKVAVERNRAIEPRSQFGRTQLASGDKLEIVRFVGGG